MSCCSSVLAASRTLTALLFLILYILVVGLPLLVWTSLTRDARLLYWCGALGMRVTLALVRIRISATGTDYIQRGRPAVYAGNHSSNLDPPAVFLSLADLFPGLRVLYKAELRKLPILVWAFDLAGFVALDRTDRTQSVPAVDQAAQALRDGNSFLIFPEGTRSRTGELLPFKKGGLIMAINAQVPVVPVAVSGARAAMRKGSLLIRPADIRVEFAPPIPTVGLTFEHRDELVQRVRSAIDRMLGRDSAAPGVVTARP